MAWIDGPAAVHLSGDRVLRVEGLGSRAWLHSLLTADLRGGSPGLARYALLLNPTGGILTDAWVVERGDGSSGETFALVLPAARAPIADETLDRYLLSAKITLSFDDSLRVISVQGSEAREVFDGVVAASDTYRCDRLGPQGLDALVDASEVDGVVTSLSARAIERGGGPVGAVEWSAARVALGVPLAGVDFDEGTSPHEAGLEGRAVSFSKGCYVGQEVVTKQQRRGGITRRLTQLSIQGAERIIEGAKVRDSGGDEIGRITSAVPANERYAGVMALGYLVPSSAKIDTPVFVGERAARVVGVVGQAQ